MDKASAGFTVTANAKSTRPNRFGCPLPQPVRYFLIRTWSLGSVSSIKGNGSLNLVTGKQTGLIPVNVSAGWIDVSGLIPQVCAVGYINGYQRWHLPVVVALKASDHRLSQPGRPRGNNWQRANRPYSGRGCRRYCRRWFAQADRNFDHLRTNR